ncbi:MAG: DUF4253 domain-containing protein [Cyanobacteria bacterium SZAS LIN-3]|nr:DUF4253 domain-containing protein [Cyanobacteria bacterium SZAS LIN-3]
MSNGKSLSAEAVLATAGVEANVQATYPIDANRDIHILAVDEKTALESAHKLAAVSEQTGFVPLFSREDYIVQKIKNSEIYHKQWEENIDSILASVPLMKADLADPIKLAGKMRPGSDEASLARVKAGISQLLTHYQFAKKGETLTDSYIKAADAVELEGWIQEMTSGYDLTPDESAPEIPYKSTIKTENRLVLVPIKKPWQIPAVLILTQQDAVPISLIQVALMKRWFEKYGASLLSFSGDTAYFEVARPPENSGIADRLALEHFAYCHDTVLQGLDIKSLAKGLLSAKVWGFWWD